MTENANTTAEQASMDELIKLCLLYTSDAADD